MSLDRSYDPDRPDVWTWLQAWYVEQCDGEWEHEFGIKIDTLDNPGWTVEVSLTGTPLESLQVERREVHRSEDDWCVSWVEDGTFNAACGPANLAEALHSLREWATATEVP